MLLEFTLEKGKTWSLKHSKVFQKNTGTLLTVFFVGPIIKANFYKKLLKLTENLDFNITFLGNMEDQDLKEIYKNSDIFILPSMPRSSSVEGFGFVFLEASSHGLLF